MSGNSNEILVRALKWIDAHGDLIGFECHSALVHGIFADLKRRRLIVRSSRPVLYELSDAGRAFLEVTHDHPR